MNQSLPTPVNADAADSLRRTALFDYLLHIIGILLSLGTLSVVAVIINYIKRPSSRGTMYESHFTWQIRTFWWTLFWVVMVTIPVMLTLGLLSFLYVLPAIWFLYRMVKGLIWLNDGKSMPV